MASGKPKVTRMNRTIISAALIAAVAAASGLLFGQAHGQSPTTIEDLPQFTHIHGLAVDAADPSRLLVATHHGFFVAAPDGTIEQVSEHAHDFMGFTPHPSDPSALYASGHPQGGGNLGFLASEDGGRTWQQLSEGANGPVDFHQMDVSKADPDVIYGVYRGLQVSRDGGHNWEIVGPAPEGLIDLAASARDSDTIYAATETGLQISMDGGQSWLPTRLVGAPVALIEVDTDARMFAFVLGSGLMRSTEGWPTWETLSEDFGDRILLHLATDPSNPDRLYAATHHSEVLESDDGGQTWSLFGAGNP
jgi:photosystem II stability/assembly factor-like uncharacterized protein